jgi:hypothetical protein
MNKEEILKKSREEYKNIDEREQQIRFKASKIAKSCGIAISFIMILLETIFIEGNSVLGLACLSIAFGMNTIEDLIVFISTKNKKILPDVIFNSIFFLASMFLFLKGLI